MNRVNMFLQEMISEYILYVDLDGVLSDFDKQFESLGYGSIDDVANKYGSKRPWIIIEKKGVSFWSEMPWMPDGKILWSRIKRYKPTILSAPMNNESSKIGKRLWVNKKLGKHVKLILEPSKTKKRYATPKSILIDDREDNIKGWNDSGGIGILHRNTKTTLLELSKIIK